MTIKNFLDGLKHPKEALTAANLSIKYDSLIEDGDYRKAIPLIRKYLKIMPEDDGAFGDLGFAFSQLERYDMALQYYENAIKIAPENPEHWSNKAETLTDIEKYDDAITAYRKSIQYEDDEDNKKAAWINIAVLCRQQDNFKRGLECVEKALDIDISDYDGWHFKASLLNDMNKHKQCLEACSEAQKIDPEESHSYLHEAESHLELGNLDKATKAVNTAIGINPNDPWGYWSNANILLVLDKKKDALKSIDKAIKIDPTDSFFYTKAMILSSMDNQEEALDALVVATAINPEPDKKTKRDLKSSKYFKNIRNLQKFKKLVSRLLAC